MDPEPRPNSGPHEAEAEQFRLVVEQVQDYAIFMMDPGGRITTWNAGAERIKGYTASEITGRYYSTFFTPEDVATGKPEEILETAVREGRAEQEGWRVRKDGSCFWASALVTAIRDRSGELLGFCKITRDVTERMLRDEVLQREMVEKEKAQQELIRSERALRHLSFELLRTQDEERRRIGRETHDSIGQYLSALKMKLGMVVRKNPALDEEGRRQIDQFAALLDQCIKEVRTISYLLYPPMLEERGLKSAIEWYLEGFRERTGLTVNFDTPAKLERPSRDVELAFFRVLQESLTNVVKHSGSSTVDIQLSVQNGKVDLTVRDYGTGLAQASEVPASPELLFGVGFRGMNERICQLGGVLTICPAAPGTVVHASVATETGSK